LVASGPVTGHTLPAIQLFGYDWFRK
jgi:hypothetical protein